MGDRANFGFQDRKGDTVFLYGHWAGYQMLERLANAVQKAEPRWTDEAYATRICISQLINEDWPGETGWGITINELSDNEHRIPIINCNLPKQSMIWIPRRVCTIEHPAPIWHIRKHEPGFFSHGTTQMRNASTGADNQV